MANAVTVDEVRRMAQAAADQLPEDPAFGDVPVAEMTDDYWDQINAAHDARWAAAVVLAEAAGFDEQLLESARPGTIDVGRQPRWDLVVFSAMCHARRTNTPDEDRARQLAVGACWGVPGSRHAYDRRHAEMALEMLDEMMWRREMRRMRENGFADHGVTLAEARAWLTEFAQSA